MMLSTLVTWTHTQDSQYWIYSSQKALGQVCVKILDSPLSLLFYHYSKFIPLSAREDRMGL